MITAKFIFQWATALYGLSLVSLCVSPMGRVVFGLLLTAALVCNAAAVALRYWQAWPMLPMHLGALALPLCMGIGIGLSVLCRPEPNRRRVLPIVLVMLVLLAVGCLFFPKDYYLPFLKSANGFAHGFFIFGVVGKACFLWNAAWAIASWHRFNDRENRNGDQAMVQPSMSLAIWGFGVWTVSMFCGELWSYLGWGTPVVWDDATITTTMATWFFYVGLLHLHLTKTWRLRARTVYAAAGAGVVFVLDCCPDFGPFRLPW